MHSATSDRAGETWKLYPIIHKFFQEHLRIRPDYDWYGIVDVHEVIMHIARGMVRAVIINETYLLVYDVGKPWYSKKRLVEEMLVVKVYDGPGTFDNVLDVLDFIRTEHGADGIVTGNSLARYPRALHRMYTRRGYQPSGTTFYRRM